MSTAVAQSSGCKRTAMRAGGLGAVPQTLADRPVSELLAAATHRELVRPPDGKSTSTFEKVTIDGERYFVKRQSRASDWIMRVTGDRVQRPYAVWCAGVLDAVPRAIDHAVVAMELDGEGEDAELTMLMRDVGHRLLPEGDHPVSLRTHRVFVDHLACLSRAFWGFTDTIGGLTTLADRIRFFAPGTIAPELVVAEPPSALVAADAGWRALAERSPALSAVARTLHADPALLTAPLAETPVTFLHGDWKMGNLGIHSDWRTILVDWSTPGSGPACWDLGWYLAINRARLPEPKEATIAAFRDHLRRRGLDTDSWFDRQMDLCLVGTMATFGWEKALGDETELRWWERAVLDAMDRQDLDLVRS
jgi:Phosphotransferase enzyme family